MKLLTLTRQNGELQAFAADHIVTFWPGSQGGTRILTVCDESDSRSRPCWQVTENFTIVKRMMEETE